MEGGVGGGEQGVLKSSKDTSEGLGIASGLPQVIGVCYQLGVPLC